MDEHPLPQDQRQDIEGDASAFCNNVQKTFGGESMDDDRYREILQRVEDIEKKISTLPTQPDAGDYPKETECPRKCGRKVWIQFSVRKQKEYLTNSESHTDFHNCDDVPF